MMRFGPVMLAIESEWPGLQSRGPETDGSSPVVIYVCVEDVGRTVERAVAAGARILRPLENQL
jgi:PhnB protein